MSALGALRNLLRHAGVLELHGPRLVPPCLRIAVRAGSTQVVRSCFHAQHRPQSDKDVPQVQAASLAVAIRASGAPCPLEKQGGVAQVLAAAVAVGSMLQVVGNGTPGKCKTQDRMLNTSLGKKKGRISMCANINHTCTTGQQ